MTQQDNWQQGVWGTSDGPTAYQKTYGDCSADPSQGFSAPASSRPAEGEHPQSAGEASSSQPASASAYASASSNEDTRYSTAGACGGGFDPRFQPQTVYAAPVAMQSRQKGKGWIVALVAVICLFLLVFFGMFSCSSMIGGIASSVEGESSYTTTTGPTVAVIELTGTIQYDGSICSPEGLKEQLDRAAADPNIKAVVLRVDSGGGTATAGEEMSVYIRDFEKPVVVSSASMNASAAYEISSQADYIYTARTTAIGGIGTYISITDISELLDKLGISIENIKSADAKDSSGGTRPLTDDERAAYQHMVTQINDYFIQTVAEGRDMSEDEVRALATGMTFTGVDAVENGLADEIGTLEDAQLKAAELGGIASGFDVVYLRQDSNDVSMLLDLMSSEESDASAEAQSAVRQ